MKSRVWGRTSIAAWALLMIAGVMWGTLRRYRSQARETAARLLGCDGRSVEVQMLALGDFEHWHVEGCGVTGTLRCEPENPGCIIVPGDP